MTGKAFIVAWSHSEAEKYSKLLSEYGWGVASECEDGYEAYKKILQMLPDVVIIDLSKKPSHGIELGQSLDETKATRNIKIVFIDGEEEDLDKIKAKIPKAEFSTWHSLPFSLAKIRRKPILK